MEKNVKEIGGLSRKTKINIFIAIFIVFLLVMVFSSINQISTIIKNRGKLFELEQKLNWDRQYNIRLLAEEKSGKYKEKQNYIIDEKGIKSFTPPSPKETPQMMEELLDWANCRPAKEMHSVLICAILHHRLVSIHPFPDGNGRLARSLGTLILYQREYDLNHIFSLDEFFANNRKKYYMKLRQARELDDDLTYWIEYVAEGVVQTLKNVKQRIEDLQVTASAPINLSPRQEEALRLLRDNPSIRSSELVKQLSVTRARMNQLLTPLIKSGLVAKEGESRATRYRLNIH